MKPTIGTWVKLTGKMYNGVVTQVIPNQCHTPEHCFAVNIDHFAGDMFNVSTEYVLATPEEIPV